MWVTGVQTCALPISDVFQIAGIACAHGANGQAARDVIGGNRDGTIQRFRMTTDFQDRLGVARIRVHDGLDVQRLRDVVREP